MFAFDYIYLCYIFSIVTVFIVDEWKLWELGCTYLMGKTLVPPILVASLNNTITCT
jgi:hypothetical protein